MLNFSCLVNRGKKLDWLKQVEPIKAVRRGISDKPWYVILYITSHCNQRCNMCFNWEMLNTLKRKDEWSLGEIERLARELPHLYQ